MAFQTQHAIGTTVTIYGALREVTDPVDPHEPGTGNAGGLRSYSSGSHYADYPGSAGCTAHHSRRGAGSR